MSTLASWMVSASAAIIFLLGLIHLLYTFRGIVLATGLYVAALIIGWT
jgi:hypothetical protein